MKRKRVIFIDRDGTLIEEGEYLRDPAQVRLIPGVTAALRALKAAGFFCVVVSNQSGLGRGLISRIEVERVQRRFVRLLRDRGVKLDGYYWCPHKPSDRCPCRKPKLGLVKRAAKDLHIDWRKSISVGDRPSDYVLGKRTGGYGLLVLTGYGRHWAKQKQAVKPDHVARDFKSAARWIIQRKDRLTS
jgi:D-glycero-D-manno-heptose 1,7-bisphosphate phosphatase